MALSNNKVEKIISGLIFSKMEINLIFDCKRYDQNTMNV